MINMGRFNLLSEISVTQFKLNTQPNYVLHHCIRYQHSAAQYQDTDIRVISHFRA